MIRRLFSVLLCAALVLADATRAAAQVRSIAAASRAGVGIAPVRMGMLALGGPSLALPALSPSVAPALSASPAAPVPLLAASALAAVPLAARAQPNALSPLPTAAAALDVLTSAPASPDAPRTGETPDPGRPVFDGAASVSENASVPVPAARPSTPRRALLKPAAVAAGLGAAATAAAWQLGAMSVPQLHMTFGIYFGWIALWQAFTGTSTLLRPVLLERFDPKLPAQTLADARPEMFTVAPAAAARAALANAGPNARIRSMALRTAPSSARKLWYEFVLEDGRLLAVHGRTGKVMISPRSVAFINEQAGYWLAGSAWSVRGRPQLMTEDGEYYRKGETPHYRVILNGPGRYQAFFSARDGRLLAAHSRMSRVLRWIGMGLHAWGIKALRRHDALKRMVAPILLGAPLLTIAGTALWMRAHAGFALDFPSLAWSAFQWHRFFGSYALFALMMAATTGPLTLMIPLINKYVTPALPPAPDAAPSAFVLSPADAASTLRRARPGAAIKTVEARSGGGEAWYLFGLTDGEEAAVSAADGALLPVLRDAAWVKAAAALWLADGPWTPKGEPVLQTDFDDLFRKGELPAYRLDLDGPGHFQVYVSARDGRLIPTYGKFSRFERFLERRVYGVHALDSGFFSRHDNLRRALLIGFVTLPVMLTVLAGMATVLNL